MVIFLIFSLICYFIALIYHIVNHNLKYFEWIENAGWSLLCGAVLWVVISCLGGVIAGVITVPDQHDQVLTKSIMDEIHYNIVPLHEYDAAYPEGLYLEAYRENDISKYRFAFETNGALYVRSISQSDCFLGYCVPETPASVVWYDRDLPTEFMRFIFIDSICDIYNIKIPHGAIYVRPTN